MKRNCQNCNCYHTEGMIDLTSKLTCQSNRGPEGLPFDVNPETRELVIGFDRQIERECCSLEFWMCTDKDILSMLPDNLDRAFQKFRERYIEVT